MLKYHPINEVFVKSATLSTVIKKLFLPIQIVRFRLAHHISWLTPLPMSLALYVTNRCNSRCKTCNIWKQEDLDELSLEEIQSILRFIGKAPLWFTLTGGESFLREDLLQIVESICKCCQPLYINIATNALATNSIEKKVPQIIEVCQRYGTKLTINISIDELFEKYDEIRGSKGGFQKVLTSFKNLIHLSQNGHAINVGTNTTLSSLNIQRFPEIYDFLNNKLKPHSILFEMASLRRTLFLIDEDISPPKEHFLNAINFLQAEKTTTRGTTARLIQFFRTRYYRHIKNLNKQNMNCYAGIASAEILSNGDVVTCCYKGELLGNLRDSSYDFKDIWTSSAAKKSRERIKKDRCSCDLANIFYTNSLINLKLFR